MTQEKQPAAIESLTTRRVLGVDPGLGTTGYAVLEASLTSRSTKILEAGVIRSGRTTKTLPGRLQALHQGILEILEAYPCQAMALEQVHSHWKHPRTAILMAHARGVIVLAAQLKGVEVANYAATRIKKTLTGSGKATKDQMQRAVQIELRLNQIPEPHDVADACAAAICHLQSARGQQGYRR